MCSVVAPRCLASIAWMESRAAYTRKAPTARIDMIAKTMMTYGTPLADRTKVARVTHDKCSGLFRVVSFWEPSRRPTSNRHGRRKVSVNGTYNRWTKSSRRAVPDRAVPCTISGELPTMPCVRREGAQNWTTGTGLVNEYKKKAGRPARESIARLSGKSSTAPRPRRWPHSEAPCWYGSTMGGAS